MNEIVKVEIPLDPDAARALDTPERREAAGRILSGILSGERTRELLAAAIADLKREVRASGVTDDDIEEELRAWRAERRR